MDLAGKKAVVFGGTSGIGLAACEQLIEKGATVVAISRDPSKVSKVPAGMTLEACDVRDVAAMEALFEKLAPFDVLISAATGGERAIGPFLEMDVDGFKASFDKLWGYANVVRYGAKHLADDGSITLVSGIPARNGKPGQIAIASVGGAVEAFAREAAREIAPKRLNVVAPGQIDTPMVALQGQARADLYKKMTEGHLIPRAGLPEEVAKGILFVVENDFVTGTVIDVDGGWLIS
jgi:NAD(P)-dependent dehydrogenase (short-subunit alcohol dehydrogenase family)